MKKLIITTACTALFGAHAFAQSSSFSGVSVGLSISSADTTYEVVRPNYSLSGMDRDTMAAFQLQYNMAVNNTFVLGFGGSALLGDLNAGKLAGQQARLKNGYALYVAPGYAFSPTWMGYGKISYLNANVQDPAGNSIRFDNGYGVGLGLQVNYNRNWFGQAELMYNQYNDRSPFPSETDKLKSSIYTITAGYRF